ncbi:MAG: hypothetical protein K5869_10980 [Saccharofermentans sp.]|nr:hypothetical protein [Saccharofermentans sp.]
MSNESDNEKNEMNAPEEQNEQTEQLEESEQKEKKVKWLDTPGMRGTRLFTFDGETVYNLFSDYPSKLSKEEKEIFDAEEPYWAEFFSGRE